MDDLIWILAIAALVLVIIVVSALLLTVIIHLIVGVPYVPTARDAVAAMIDAAKLRGDERIYDIGAGDARFLVEAKRRYPGITAIGYELVPTVWLLGKWRIWRHRQDVTLRMRNALKQSYGDADVIFLYLFPSLLEKLEPLFDRQLKPGTRVISLAFRFPTRQPVQSLPVRQLGRETKMHFYQW